MRLLARTLPEPAVRRRGRGLLGVLGFPQHVLRRYLPMQAVRCVLFEGSACASEWLWRAAAEQLSGSDAACDAGGRLRGGSGGAHRCR